MRIRPVLMACAAALVVAAPASAAPPLVSGFAPTSGPVGTAVTVSGSGFTGATAVTFAGTAAGFSVTNDTTIQTSVPSGATTGKVMVTTPAGTGTSTKAFKVVPQTAGFTPASGTVGTIVVITGTAFTEATAVTFGGVPAVTFTVDGYTQITATVPPSALSGPVAVATLGGTGQSAANFTVVPPPSPTISLSQPVGPPTTTLAVGGAHFQPNAPVDIFFDTTDVALATTDGTGTFSAFSITVPAWAQPGAHWVTASVRWLPQAAQASFLVRTDWPQFRYTPRHRALNMLENALYAFVVPGLDLQWNAAIGGFIQSSPAVAGGNVYVGAGDARLYAFDAASGGQLWSAATGNSVESSPAVANGLVYVGSNDHKVYAFNARTGARVWSTTTGDVVQSCPAVTGMTVYVGSYDGVLYALNALSGARLWSAPIGSILTSSPAIAGGVVYIGAYNGKLYAFNAGSGAPLWSAATGGPIAYSSPAVANGAVYVGSDDGKLYAFNAATGGLLWSASTGGGIQSSPAVANGVVYVGSDDDQLYAFSARSGVRLWSASTGGLVQSSPAVASGVVYVGSNDEKVYAFSAASGGLIWSAATGGALTFDSPAVASGVVYASSQDGKLYAYGLATPAGPIARPDPADLVPDPTLQPRF